MANHVFIAFLKKHLNTKELPGRSAQLKMIPRPVDKLGRQRSMAPPSNAISSSVLALLFPNEADTLEVLLTLRTAHIDHGGQISFPGGRTEPNETVVETALRETQEEVGIDVAEVSIIGKLSKLYVQPSNSNITPIIGFLDDKPQITPNPNEVEEAFSVSLDTLFKDENRKTETWELRKNEFYKVPFWDLHRVPLWGATAMILSELMMIYEGFKSMQ